MRIRELRNEDYYRIRRYKTTWFGEVSVTAWDYGQEYMKVIVG